MRFIQSAASFWSNTDCLISCHYILFKLLFLAHDFSPSLPWPTFSFSEIQWRNNLASWNVNINFVKFGAIICHVCIVLWKLWYYHFLLLLYFDTCVQGLLSLVWLACVVLTYCRLLKCHSHPPLPKKTMLSNCRRLCCLILNLFIL